MAEFSKRHDSKLLIIMRHAEADWGLDDFNRPLTKRGYEQAATAGKWLMESEIVPEMIISSAALRTRQTTTWIEDALGEKAPTASLDERLYNAPSSSLISAINNAPASVNSLMLVAHLPGVQDAALQLMRADSAVEASTEISYGFPPASIAIFEVLGERGELAEGEAKLINFRVFS